MRSISKSIISLLLIMLSMQVCAQEITTASAKEFMGKLDKAISEKDAEKIGTYISDNVDISGKITSGGETQSFRYNKAQYMAVLRDTWAQASSYTYRRSNENISVSGGKATVTADISE